MKFNHQNSEVFIADETPVEKALVRTTHLGIGAHQDDLEIMAIDGILKCFNKSDNWFTGVVVTDGGGSPRSGKFADFTDDEMKEVRVKEQKKASEIGKYSAQILLNYPSSIVKDKEDRDLIDDIRKIMGLSNPSVVYIHNLADKHSTHVSTAVKVIKAIRQLPKEKRPMKLYGCEVWRDLGWMKDDQKVAFDCSENKELQESLLSVFESQIEGGKRYDLATMGRRLANATYFASHKTDNSSGLVFAMDLSPLVHDVELDILGFINKFITGFSDDVQEMVNNAI